MCKQTLGPACSKPDILCTATFTQLGLITQYYKEQCDLKYILKIKHLVAHRGTCCSILVVPEQD